MVAGGRVQLGFASELYHSTQGILIQFFGGNPTWCFATLTEQGKRVEKTNVREGNEGLGPLAGDRVDAARAQARRPAVDSRIF